MKFKIDNQVFDKFPNLIVALPIIMGFDNTKAHDQVLKLLRNIEENLRKTITLDDFWKDKRVIAYLECFKSFGVDPEKFRPAHIALAKRVLEGGQLPDINPIVNLYNAFSIKYLTPFGGENLNALYGDFILRFAVGGEQWIPIGDTKSKSAIKGELIWRDDYDLSTRSLNWRQCDRTKMTPEVRNGYFVMDGFFGINDDNIKEAAHNFVKTATELFGGEGKIYWLDKDNPEIEISFKSKILGTEMKKYISDVEKKNTIKIVTPKREKPQIGKIVDKKSLIYQLARGLAEAVNCVLGKEMIKPEEIHLEHPAHLEHGDYSCNIALKIKTQNSNLKTETQISKLTTRELAKEIVAVMIKKKSVEIEKVDVAGPGFINIWLSKGFLLSQTQKVLTDEEKYGSSEAYKGKKIMVEFAHPNTHKELHIGHMRTLITGEALARIFTAAGAEVFRANYQGDIGPHVAKAIWGTQKILSDKKIDWHKVEEMPLRERIHLIGEGYVRGNTDYEQYKDEIDKLNKDLYKQEKSVWSFYEMTRKWNLDYYEEFYHRFYTRFDRLFFESEVAEKGRGIVLDNMGKIFMESDGAIIFDGEKYGLHKRVFITTDKNPTYEAKEMALGPMQFTAFPFDLCVHVVANEQAGYFSVVFKALELIDKKFQGREYHLPMGMVTLVGRKMSSRTGEILTVDKLLDDIKNIARPLVNNPDLKEDEEKEDSLEKITIAAIKYSILRSNPELNSVFDVQKSVSLDGDSGPYLQYTYARCRSVMRKAELKVQSSKLKVKNFNLNIEEMEILRTIYRFPEIIQQAAEEFAPNIVCNYLFDLAQKYNLFYQKCQILNAGEKQVVDLRLILTAATAQVLRNGLHLLGIEAPERM